MLLNNRFNLMLLSKALLVLLFIIGLCSSLFSQTNPSILKAPPSIGDNTYLDIRTPSIEKIRAKIDHVIRYYDYCGPTKETFLYFDSTGRLIAQYRGPWIRNANVPPGPTSSTIYTLLNPAPSFFFQYKEKSYYYNSKTKKKEELPYRAECENEGFVAVQRIKDHKCAFLNKKAEPICPFIYDKLDYFNNGIAIVQKEGKTGLIDTAGKEVIPCIYQSIKILYSGQIEAKKAYKKFDYFNKKGKPVLFPKKD
jgi:hypothetical protein